MGFFENLIFDINRQHCKRLGIDTTVYDVPLSAAESGGRLSADEAEIADFMALGVNRKGAEMCTELAKTPPTPLTWNPRPHPAPVFRAVVEYASPRRPQTRIEPYYEECRAARDQRAGVWVGD